MPMPCATRSGSEKSGSTTVDLDALEDSVFSDLLTHMTEGPRNISFCVHLRDRRPFRRCWWRGRRSARYSWSRRGEFGFVTALHALDHISFRLEIVCEQESQIRFVLDDENPGRRGGAGAGETSIPWSLARWPWISRTLMPRAYIDTILSSKPGNRR